MDQINELLVYISVIAVSAERITDIVKRMVLQNKEVNSSVYQLLTFACGVAAALIQPPEFKFFNFEPYMVCILVGLIVSGSSSAWHEILSSLNNFSKTLKTQASQTSVITENLAK